MKKVFLIIRIYPKNTDNEDHVYGWTHSINVVKSFMMQRNNKKYKVIKTDTEEVEEIFSENLFDSNQIDFVMVPFANSDEKIPFYTHKDELEEVELNIQRYKDSLCSLEQYDAKTIQNLIDMISALDYVYEEALDVIGFRPPEMESLYPGHDDEDRYYEDIYNAYSTYCVTKKHSIPGIEMLSDLSTKILYSVESFIKVLKDDL